MFKALTNIVRNQSASEPSVRAMRPTRFPQDAFSSASQKRAGGIAIIDPSDAVKSNPMGLFSRSALDFINSASNEMSTPYTENQLLNAYLTSVYVYAALRRVSNLISRVKVVGEVQQEGKWVRLPETHMLNQLFARDGSETMSRMWLNHAVYGAANVYKIKTRRAMLQEQSGHPIYDFADGAVAGLYVLDKPVWDVDEDVTYGAIRGFYVNQYESGDNLLGNRNYLKREETIYYTDWNPQSPNRGKSMVAVCIHEAVANASIAQWISEYFTRGAMPFIMVSLAEDDPAMMTDGDLRKYKRQFEEYWQGMGNSLRSVFFDRQINVEQVGIPADEVAAPDLNETALEGIAATIGLDRELIVTPSGGSQERHALLVKRAWEDTVIPLAEKYVAAINRDLGLAPNMRLVLDVSGIAELEADRENKADTEIGIYDSQLQSYNEARTRLKMAPVKELDGFYNLDGRLVPLSQLVALGNIPHNEIVDYAMQLWDGNLALRSEVLAILGRNLPANAADGYRYQIEDQVDLITTMWNDDLLPRSSVLERLGFTSDRISVEQDGYRSELERGADYGEWVTDLWDRNLLTRSQTMELLDMGLTLPPNAPDGYADEIGDRKSNIMDMWGDNLLTRRQTLDSLGYESPEKMIDGYAEEIEIKLDMIREAENERVERILDFWNDNLLTRGQALTALGVNKPQSMIDGYADEIDREIDVKYEAKENLRDYVRDLWGDNLLTRQQTLEMLGIEQPASMIDGYADEIENIADEISTKIGELEAEEVAGTYNPEGEEGVRLVRRNDPDDDPDGPPNPPKGLTEAEVAESDSKSDWQQVIEETTDPFDDLLHTLRNSPDNIAIEAAEEDWLEGYGEYPYDNLESHYGDLVDILPEETLPESDMLNNEMFDMDSWLNDTEIEVRDSRFYGPGDYYDNIAAAFDEEHVTSDALSNEDMDIIESEVLSETSNYDPQSYTAPAIEVPMFEPVGDFDLPAEEVDRGASDDTENQEAGDSEILDATSRELGSKDIIRKAPAQSRALYVSLWVGDNDRLSELQDELDNLMGSDPDIKWCSPDKFHVTLVYALDITDEDVQKVIELLPDDLPIPTLKAHGVSTFDNDGETVIKLDVDPSDELSGLQAKVATAFSAYGIELSPYSDPGEYKPHVTLAYAPPETQLPDMTGLNTTMYVQPITVSIGRDNYEAIEEIPAKDIRDLMQGDNEIEIDVAGDLVVEFGGNVFNADNIGDVEIEYEGEAEPYWDEPDGTENEKWMSDRERRETESRYRKYERNNNVSKLKRWYKNYQRANQARKNGAPTEEVDTLHAISVEELPESIYRSLSEYIMTDSVTDQIVRIAEDAIRKGLYDKEVFSLVDPIKEALSNIKARQNSASEELGAWERATLKRGINKGLRFETEHIPADMAENIKDQIANINDGDVQGIKDIFTKAKITISTNDDV